ncbi:MAG: helix-turn-helix transcriptional regulator [Denitromonas halophila]|nr:MAG: helix-turn-helix transcriptional regulator [Denitromonas halophila]TVT72853.1 MAG: helix-turn-helix transcriptional regulator [Denitromonas halophila]
MSKKACDDIVFGRSTAFLESIKQSTSPGKVLVQTVAGEAKLRGVSFVEAAHRCGVMRVYLEKLSDGRVDFSAVQPATWLPFARFLSIDPAAFLIATGRLEKSDLAHRNESSFVLECARDAERRWLKNPSGYRLSSLIDSWSSKVQASARNDAGKPIRSSARKCRDASLWKQLKEDVCSASGGTLLRWLAFQGLELGTSFEDLARFIGMSARQLSELFHGRRDPRSLPRSTIQQAASLIGVSPAGVMCAAGLFGNLHETEVAQ